MNEPAWTGRGRRLLHQADTLGYEVKVSTHGDILTGTLEHAVVRLVPATDHARKRLRLAGREDRVLECSARAHPDAGMEIFAIEAALEEALRLHTDSLGLVVI